jgi:arylsulfatase A-like enzyme
MSGRVTKDWVDDPNMQVAAHRDVTGPRVLAAVQRWIDARTARNDTRPVFLFVHLWDVHYDFVPPPPYDTTFDSDYSGDISGANFFFDSRIRAGMPSRDLAYLEALYDGEIAWTDETFGRIRDALEEADLLDDGILAVTADHGDEFFEHGGKGHRQTLFREVLRVPLLLRAPGRLPAGRRIQALSRGIDLAPTLLDLAGLPGAEDCFGTSLRPVIAGSATGHAPRALSELFSNGRIQRMVRTARWKFVDDMARNQRYFIDLQADPGEQRGRTDFDSELGARAEAGYLAEVRALEAFAASRVVPAASPNSGGAIPAEVLERLNHLGYTGDGPEHVPPSDR